MRGKHTIAGGSNRSRGLSPLALPHFNHYRTQRKLRNIFIPALLYSYVNEVYSVNSVYRYQKQNKARKYTSDGMYSLVSNGSTIGRLRAGSATV